MKLTKWVIINDHHFPFEDKRICRAQVEFIKREKPTGVIHLGDLVDFYQCSRFNKDPKRANQLQCDIDQGVEFLSEIRSVNAKMKIKFIPGNHEKRLKKYLWGDAPALASLRALQLEPLLQLKKLRIEFCSDGLQIGDMSFFHGDIVRKHASYTAKAMFEKHGVTLMAGHTHRDGKYTVRNRRGHFAVWENYCSCSLWPEYADFPNWSQGFACVTFADNRPYVEQVAVIGKKYIYGGKVYKV